MLIIDTKSLLYFVCNQKMTAISKLLHDYYVAFQRRNLLFPGYQTKTKTE